MITRLIDHLIWADDRANESLASLASPDPALLRIQAHIFGSQAVWVARITGDNPTVAVWPEADMEGCRRLADQSHALLRQLLARLEDPAHPRSITYTNTKGETFTNDVMDILHHVALHSSYHRGQVIRGIRAQGGEPLPTDFIVFVRGR